jgi:methylmalonyl-CoA mutase
VQGIAVSSYQGGHVEFFRYMIDLLRERGGAHVKVFGGGGGVIVPAEAAVLHAYGVTRIYTPEDGARMGLQGMINDVLIACDFDQSAAGSVELQRVAEGDRRQLAGLLTLLENGTLDAHARADLRERALATRNVPVLGITGTGGSGKSSLTDELVRRLRLDQNDCLKVALIAVDPSRRKSGGALLGDRIRYERDLQSAHLYALACDARLAQRTGNLRARCHRRLQNRRLRSDPY